MHGDLTDGHVCLRSLPNTAEKPALTDVHRIEERELKALDEFIAYKTRCLERLQNVEKNLQAIEETKWLKEYLEHFLDANREAQRALPFWPHQQDRNGVEDLAPKVEVRTEDCSSPAEVGLIMATMPDPKARGYFGPRRNRPATIPSTRAPRRRTTRQVHSRLEKEPAQEERIVSQHSTRRLTFEWGIL
jgi:hypothetical protein